MLKHHRWFSSGVGCAAAVLSLGSVFAACPCQKSGSMAMPVSQYGGGIVDNGFLPAPGFDPMMQPGPQMMPPAPPVMPMALPGQSSEPVGTPIPGTNRFGMAPPPGTLGKTYQRRTTLLPDDKHPRIGMVNVYVAEDVDVTARGLKSKWNGKYWVLETEAPLLPGTPHIYAIKTEKTLPSGQKQVDVRWIRLIMGRVVDLEL